MHIDEHILEKLILSPESFTDTEKSEIVDHLNECALCIEAYDAFKKIYRDINEEAIKEPTENDKDLANRIKTKIEGKEEQKLLKGYSTAIRIYDGNAEIIGRQKVFTLQNIYYFIKNYPLPSLGFTIVASLAIAFIVGQVKIPFKDNNPVSVRIDNNSLKIFNNSGELLWTKPSVGLKKAGIDTLTGWLYNDQKCIDLLDIDTNGKNEVLIAGNESDKGVFSYDSLYCFNYDGSLRWVVSGESRKGMTVPKWKMMKYWIRDFFTIKVGKVNKLFMISNDRMYGGAVISEINPKNGEILSSIFHAGWFSAEGHLDIDGDSNEEIILGGTSSDYHRPFLLVLKYGTAEGVIPRSETHTEDNKIKTNPLYYILFPISELGKKESKSTDNDVTTILKAKNSEFLVGISDVKIGLNKNLGLVYTLDMNMKIKSIMADNSYEKIYTDQVKTGKIKQPLNSTFFKALADSIRYWDSDKFVNYPSKNEY